MKFLIERYNEIVHKDPVTGQIVQKASYDPETGELHRIGEPALVRFAEVDGTQRRRDEYFFQGKAHREGDDPQTVIVELKSGVEVHRSWRKCDSMHRPEGKPAVVKLDHKTGVVTLEEYWERGQMHRIDGPALIERDAETGEVTKTSTFVHGQEVIERGPEGPQPG